MENEPNQPQPQPTRLKGDRARRIGLAVMLVLVAAAIVYLENIQAHRGASDGAPAQAISVDTLAATSTTNGTGTTATKPTTVAISPALKALAVQDNKQGLMPAIELANPTGFVNSSPFKLSDYIGKDVILLDFWTYSCVNCIRTLPYLTAWYSKYKDQGFVIVGVHTPEFDFEKNIANVKAATQKYGVQYPVVLDSNYGTWNTYNNLYWPHEYLIDLAGYVVHDQIGEGNYPQTEAEIQKLLAQRAQIIGMNPQMIATGTVNVAPSDLSGIQSPETYFGAARNNLLANGAALVNGVQTLTQPASTAIQLNHLYLSGTWNFDDQFATNQNAGAKVFYEFDSGKVYIVASAAASAVTVEVLEDGQPVSDANAGADVKNGKATIQGSRLYNLINNTNGPGAHTLELIIDQPGLQAYTFTFG